MVGEPDATRQAPEESEQAPETDLDVAAAWAREHWRIVLVIAVALLLGIACHTVHFNPDSIHYVDVARTIVEEHVVGTWHLTADSQRAPDTLLYWPPVYPLALALFIGIGLSVGFAAWAVSVLGYTVSAWLLARWQRHPALAVAGVLAFLHLAFSAGAPFRAWSESVYVPLMLGSLVVMASAVGSGSARRGAWLGLLAGALGGGAMLTRYIGLSLAPALAGAAVLAPGAEGEEKGTRRNSILTALGGMALVVIPWLVRNMMLNGRLMGPARPPNTRSLSYLTRYIVGSVYLDLVPLLLVFIFVLIGYHMKRSDPERGASPEEVHSGALVWGAVIAGLAQFGIIVLSYLIFFIDEPPTKRYFFPAYTCLLLAALAMMSRARLPERVLARRWELLVVLAAPLVIAPLLAEASARDVTPPYTELDRWVEENTDEDDLLIADRGWPLRFHTGRVVLEAGQVAAPPITDGEKVAAFLERFEGLFDDVYLLPGDREETKEALSSYRAARLEVEEVATVETQPHDYRRMKRYEQTIYRVERRDGGG